MLIHGIQVVPAIYDQLFEFDITKGPRGTGEYTLEDHNWLALGALRGQVIESNEVISPTQMKWKVRRGIHYHNRPPANGRELTREDVLVTWATVAAEPRAGLMYKGDEILKMTPDPSDDWTINVEMSEPDTLGLWAYIITSLNGVLPAEYWRDTSINREDWRNHMGSGPYFPTEVVEGSHITYAKNPDYWQTDPLNPGNQLPYLDTMQIVAFADGSAGRGAAQRQARPHGDTRNDSGRAGGVAAKQPGDPNGPLLDLGAICGGAYRLGAVERHQGATRSDDGREPRSAHWSLVRASSG